MARPARAHDSCDANLQVHSLDSRAAIDEAAAAEAAEAAASEAGADASRAAQGMEEEEGEEEEEEEEEEAHLDQGAQRSEGRELDGQTRHWLAVGALVLRPNLHRRAALRRWAGERHARVGGSGVSTGELQVPSPTSRSVLICLNSLLNLIVSVSPDSTSASLPASLPSISPFAACILAAHLQNRAQVVGIDNANVEPLLATARRQGRRPAHAHAPVASTRFDG